MAASPARIAAFLARVIDTRDPHSQEGQHTGPRRGDE